MTEDAERPPPKLSILLLCWNHAQFLDDCLGSLARQQSQDFEIVLLDNMSVDGSFELAQKLLDKFQLPGTLIRNQHPGSIPANLNRLLEASHGPLVAVLSTDDWYEPTYVGSMISAAASHPEAGWFSCSGWLFYDSDQRSVPVDDSQFVTDQRVVDVIVDWKDPHFYVGCAYRRAALEAIGGWDEGQLIEDRDLFLRLSQDFSHHTVAKRLVHYRQNDTTASADARFMTKGWDLFFAKHGALWGSRLAARRAEVYRSAAAVALDQRRTGLAAHLLWRSLITRPRQTMVYRTMFYWLKTIMRPKSRSRNLGARSEETKLDRNF